MIDQGFIYRGAGLLGTSICLVIVGAIAAIVKAKLFKKRAELSPVILDLLVFLAGVVLLMFSFGRDGQSYPATDGIFAKLVTSEVMAGPLWYKPSLIWYAICACSAASFVLRHEDKKALASAFAGLILAVAMYYAVVVPIENSLFDKYIDSGSQAVIRDSSAVASHIIAVASCVGIMVMHVISSITAIMKDAKE